MNLPYFLCCLALKVIFFLFCDMTFFFVLWHDFFLFCFVTWLCLRRTSNQINALDHPHPSLRWSFVRCRQDRTVENYQGVPCGLGTLASLERIFVNGSCTICVPVFATDAHVNLLCTGCGWSMGKASICVFATRSACKHIIIIIIFIIIFCATAIWFHHNQSKAKLDSLFACYIKNCCM